MQGEGQYGLGGKVRIGKRLILSEVSQVDLAARVKLGVLTLSKQAIERNWGMAIPGIPYGDDMMNMYRVHRSVEARALEGIRLENRNDYSVVLEDDELPLLIWFDPRGGVEVDALTHSVTMFAVYFGVG